MPRPAAFDRWIFFVAGLLVLAGAAMVASASPYVSLAAGRSPYHFFLQHAVHVALGAALCAGAMAIPYQRLADARVVAVVMAVSIGLLVLVFAFPPVGGARRWIRLGPVTLQPSELVKLGIVVFMAYLLYRREEEIEDVYRVPIPALLTVGVPAILVLKQPDLGSAFMLVFPAFVMAFVAGLRLKHAGAAIGAGAVLLIIAILVEEYRFRRFWTFLFPQEDTQGPGFQLAQSVIALGSGGLTGVGWGQGQQKAFFLPAAHTDFIFSVIGEERGLVGTLLLLAAFVILFWRGVRTARRAPDRFGFHLALGITTLLVTQALINISVCLGLLPTKGLPLPFISYGGSSLVVSMAAVGLLLNVSRHSN